QARQPLHRQVERPDLGRLFGAARPERDTVAKNHPGAACNRSAAPKRLTKTQRHTPLAGVGPGFVIFAQVVEDIRRLCGAYAADAGSLAPPGFSYCFGGLASRKSFTIGTMMGMRCISVTCVVSGKMANRDAERGLMSPWISPPFRRNISATCSSRTPSASP